MIGNTATFQIVITFTFNFLYMIYQQAPAWGLFPALGQVLDSIVDHVSH